MSLLEERGTVADGDLTRLAGGADPTPETPVEVAPVAPPSGGTLAPVNPTVVSVAAALGAAAAGFMMAGVFGGLAPRLIAVAGGVLGAAIVGWSFRFRRPSTVQFMAAPVALVLGALLVLPDAKGGSANLPSLVAEALQAGGIASPPVPFDPGWRLILTVITVLLGATAAALAVALERPSLAALLPAPIIFGAALVQPPDAEIVSVVVSLALGGGALVIAYGAQLARSGASSATFELRRLLRAGGIMAGLVVLLLAVTRLGFLFPEPQDGRVIPPKRPETPPAQRDRVVFTVASDRAVPWRLGVLDVYDKTAWLTPPYDPARFVELSAKGRLPGFDPDGLGRGVPAKPAPVGPTFKATFTVQDIQGRVVPSSGSASTIALTGQGGGFDPRTGAVQLDGRARRGTRYTVEATVPPDAAALAAAPEPSASMAAFSSAPTPPAEVRDLIASIPLEAKSAFERLQFVRTKFYENVVAAGAGAPVDVPPARVADMLAGQEGTPYEITAAEALLARWVGVPARVGYGYFGGDPVAGQAEVELRPKHGAMWLEVWFEGHGWVSIVGRPPQAKSSLDKSDKNDDPTVRPTDELGLVVYHPLRASNPLLVYEIVRFWVAKVLPIAAGVVLFAVFFPGILKLLRSVRRRRWAAGLGPRSRIAVAYGEFRDAAIDLNVGHPSDTALEFLDAIVPDPQHRELAWLVTRGLWGDLARDLSEQDAETAESMGRSMTRRMVRAQSPLVRALAFASRESLRRPFGDDIPNLWVELPRRPRFRDILRPGKARAALRSLRARPVRASAVLLLIAVLSASTGCARDVDLVAPAAASTVSEPVVPDTLGALELRREPDAEVTFEENEARSLVASGRVYTVRQGEEVQGSLQVGWLKPGLGERKTDVRRQIIHGIGGGQFVLSRLGEYRVYDLRLPEQRMMLWFDEDSSYYELLVARAGFADADRFFLALLAGQQGGDAPGAAELTNVPSADPRRGSNR